MRVSSSPERGAVLPFVALCAVVIFGVGALAVDLGNGWVTRRNLITSTDAAARAAAQEFAKGGNGCVPTFSTDYVLANRADAVNIVCDPNMANQFVTVDAEANVDTWFAGVLGLGDFDTFSSSTVQWGAAASATGLRPIAVCAENEELGPWLANRQGTLTIKIDFTNPSGQPDLCNNGNTNVAGNWGLMDFDGAGGNDSKEWVKNGYPGEVNQGSAFGTCTDEPWACYPPQTGELTQVKAELSKLVANGTEVILPIINYAVDSGGNTGAFHVMGFVKAIFVEVKLTGTDAQRYITIQFQPGFISGTCCAPSGGYSNLSVIQACAVDRQNLGNC